MPDNVDFTSGANSTPPAGTKVATDEAGAPARHYQLVKLVDGTVDGTSPISGDAANGLDVDVTRVSGVVAVNDNAGSLTVDTPQLPGALVSGRLSVDASAVAVPVTDNAGSLTVDNGGTFAVQDSEKIVDNAGFTDGTSKVLPAGFIFDEVAGTALTENDVAAGRVDAKRSQVGVIEDATTRGQRAAVSAAGRLSVDASGVAVPVTDNAGSLTVDAPVGTPVAARLSDGAAFLTTTSGRLSVDASAVAVPVTDNAGSLTVDNAGTFAIQDSEKIADNAAFTDGTTKVMPSGLIFDEVAGTALTENDIGAARMDSKRAAVYVLEDATTRGQRATVTAANALKVDASGVAVPITDNAGSLTVDAPVGTPVFVRISSGAAAVDTIPVDSELPAAAALADAAANPTAPAVGSFGMIWNGATWDRETTIRKVQGDVADAAADSGNPVKAGGKFLTTQPTYTDAQRGTLQLDSRGCLRIVVQNGVTVASVQTPADGQTATSGLVASAKGMLFNGTNDDRARNNWNTTTGDTGAKVATFNGATQTNFDAVGAYITILLGTVSGTTPTLAAQLQFSFDGGTTWLNLGPAMANLTTTAQTGLFIAYPSNVSQAAGATPANLTTGATQVVALNMPLPRTWRLTYTIGGTTPSFAITSVNVNYVRG